mmetsp:Transcript_23593/g.70567  ORF Transcript_23593/g.70567 Transcript_23593/m.70567 type:complete len:1201 (+) Transcript_23593:224-3826(+)
MAAAAAPAGEGKEARLRAAAEKLQQMSSGVVTQDVPVHELPFFKCLKFHNPERKSLLDKYVELCSEENKITLVQIPKAQSFHDQASEKLAASLLLANKVGAAKTDKTARKIKNKIMQTNDVVVQCQSAFYACSTVCDQATNITMLLQRELILAIEIDKQTRQLEIVRTKIGGAKPTAAQAKEVRSLERKVERNRVQLATIEKTLGEELARTETKYNASDGNWGVLRDVDQTVWTVVFTAVFRRLAFAKLLLAEASSELERLKQERMRVPQLRDEVQREIAKVATKQYRLLAKKYHTDRGGGDEDKFNEIKLAQRVITDTAYKDAKGGGSNLLFDYITRRDHDKFMVALKQDEVRQAKSAAVSTTVHAMKKESGKYVADDRAGSSARPAPLMIEGGAPPMAKKPFAKEIRSQKTNNRALLQISWGPGNHRASRFELQVRKVGTDIWPTTYEGDRDYVQIRMRFPAIFEMRARGGNSHGWGVFSHEATFELDSHGFLVTEADGTEEDAAVRAKQRAHTAKAAALNALKRVVNQVNEAVQTVLHQHDRPKAIGDLKQVILQNKQYQAKSEQHATLLAMARELLVQLRRKELTKEWRNELKSWGERVLLDSNLTSDEVELDVRTRLRSLDPDRLNWFLQFQLTHCKKVADSYRGPLTSHPSNFRMQHRQLVRVLRMMRETDEISAKLKGDFEKRINELEAALNRSDTMEQERRQREAGQENRRLQREKEWQADRQRRERELEEQLQLARQRTATEEKERQERRKLEEEAAEKARLQSAAEAAAAAEAATVAEAEASATAAAVQTTDRIAPAGIMPAAAAVTAPTTVPDSIKPDAPTKAPDRPFGARSSMPPAAIAPPTFQQPMPASNGRGRGGQGRRRGRGARSRLDRPPNDAPPVLPPVVTASPIMGDEALGDMPPMPFPLPSMLPPLMPMPQHTAPPQLLPNLLETGGWEPVGSLLGDTTELAPPSAFGDPFGGEPPITANGGTFSKDTSKGAAIDTKADESGSSALLDHRIREFLQDNHMTQYAEIFSANEIDFDTLLELEAHDLAAMGITKVGPQKKLVKAIAKLRQGGGKEKSAVGVGVPGTNPHSPEFKPTTPTLSGADEELNKILGTGWDEGPTTQVWGGDAAGDSWGSAGTLLWAPDANGSDKAAIGTKWGTATAAWGNVESNPPGTDGWSTFSNGATGGNSSSTGGGDTLWNAKK